jgi:CelD/BcsL family acetyltransferase involved in cellulose biosynthesis
VVGVGHIEIVDRLEESEGFRDAWQSLAVERENPFLSPQWYDAWHDRDRERPRLLVWRRQPGGAVAGVLPLVLERRGGLRALRFAGARRGDWFGLACAVGDEPAMARACEDALTGRDADWDTITLPRMICASGEDGGGRLLRSTGTVDVLPYLDLSDGYDGWLATRSRNFRSQLGRRRRRADRDHALAFRVTGPDDDLTARMEELFGLHDARRTAAGGEGLLPRSAKDAHIRFARLARAEGWLRLYAMDLDGETVAAWYGWTVGRRCCYAMSGFDPASERAAVGTLMLAHTIESAAAEGALVYDMLWGDEDYKSRFETGRRSAHTLVAGRGARGKAVVAGQRASSRVRGSLPAPLKDRLRRVRTRLARER